MPFTIVRQDITKMTVDAIVNAANIDLKMGGGVCGAIFKAAGARELQAACDKVAPIKTGQAAITPGFALPCKYVIHAAGPVYRHKSAEQSEKLLRSAYMESLRLAVDNKCESIAFPLNFQWNLRISEGGSPAGGDLGNSRFSRQSRH